MSTTEERQREIATTISGAFVDAYNTGATGLIDDVVTDDFVCHHTAAGEELHGADEYKTRIDDLRSAFSDFSMAEEQLIVDGDRAAGYYRWGGTNDGEFMGAPATGAELETRSLTMMRMEGDKMAEMWVYGDNADVARQLGIER
ncbi:ester cyclase [Halobaculum marinum]|uniref:Ester cyclase n=1 Tax=Halobaculum marinum TaxID=3031996 RepID=A0ABD5WWQ6_9EURY|nr:ester cyclase [Halobaculum sp. DT55]